jgi:outer membrane protein assembly factor BamB
MMITRLLGLSLLLVGTILSSCDHALSHISAPAFSTAPASSGWPVYHKDAARTGFATGPSFASVEPAWHSDDLDGDIYASPLVADHKVIIATENNTLYALDSTSGSQLWQTHLGDPVTASTLPCGDIGPVTGITGTPAIDTQTNLIYTVAFLSPGRHELFAVRLADGTVAFHRPIDPPGASPLVHQQRAALALANGYVYIAYGGLWGDCGDYHGWIVAAPAMAVGNSISYEIPCGGRCGIWAPSGPAIDTAGNLYVTTGNSLATDTFDYGDAVIKLSPDLHLVDWFAPSDWTTLNREDLDLGTIGPALLEDGLIFQGGKSGIGYLLAAARLSQFGPPVFSAPVCDSIWGGTAYAPPLLFVPCADGLRALQIALSSFTVLWQGPEGWAEPPIVAGGAVWFLDRSGTLRALDVNTGQVRYQESVGQAMHFATAAFGDSQVLFAVGSHVLSITLKN